MGSPFEQPTLTKDNDAQTLELESVKRELQESQLREQRLLDQLLVAPAPLSAPAEPPKPPVAEPPKPALAMEGGELETVIRGARMLVAADHPDFARFASEIDALMARMSIDMRKQVRIWEEVYWNVRGRHADELVSEARKTPSPSERPTNVPAPVAEDHVTNPVELDMMTKMGFTEKQWLARRKQMGEGQWEVPMT